MVPAPGVMAGTRPYFCTVGQSFVVHQVDAAQAHFGAVPAKVVEGDLAVAPARDGLLQASGRRAVANWNLAGGRNARSRGEERSACHARII